MKNNSKNRSIKQLLLLISSLLLFVSCGYKPVSYYTKHTIDKPVYLIVKILDKEPDNGVYLKDALRDMIVHRLGFEITRDRKAENTLIVSYEDIGYTPLGYDANGYVSRYRVNVKTNFVMKSKGKVSVINMETSQEADVNPNALESSRIKKEAIIISSKKAIDQFVAYIGSKSVE